MQQLWLNEQAQMIATRLGEDLLQLRDSGESFEDLVGKIELLLPMETRVRLRDENTFLASIQGSGKGRLLLLSNLTYRKSPAEVLENTSASLLLGHPNYSDCGGLALACAAFRSLSLLPELYSNVALAVLADNETGEHLTRLLEGSDLDADALLSFTPGQREGKLETVVVGRQGLFEMQVNAQGPSLAGVKSEPLLAGATLDSLSLLVKRLAVHIIEENEEIAVVPYHLHTESLNKANLRCAVHAFERSSAYNMLELVPPELKGVSFRASIEELYPPFRSKEQDRTLLTDACEMLGRPLLGMELSSPHQVSLLAEKIPEILDGLGLTKRQQAGHEYYDSEEVLPQAEVVLSLALSSLYGLEQRSGADFLTNFINASTAH